MPRPRNASRQTRDLLENLLASPRVWRHGYELSKDTGLKSGTLYPLLMRLSDQALLDSKWQEPAGAGRPPRHVYRLNKQGLALARQLSLAPEPASLMRRRRAVEV
jgi:PadR family transcriptional regulator, regulatory protein PadR